MATPNVNDISEPIENSINQTRTGNFISVKVITQRKSPRNIHARVNSTLGTIVREIRSIVGPGPLLLFFFLDLELAGIPGRGPGLLHLVADLDKPEKGLSVKCGCEYLNGHFRKVNSAK